jgi:hypothetical protein
MTSMDAGLAALLGALIGGLVGAGTAWMQGRRDKAARAELAQAERIERLLATYIDFSESARTVRYAALRQFQGHPPTAVMEMDRVLTSFSRAYYMIELLAPDETARLAKALRDSAEELWRRSADLAGAPKPKWEDEVRRTRAAAQAFRRHVKREVPFSADEAG